MSTNSSSKKIKSTVYILKFSFKILPIKTDNLVLFEFRMCGNKCIFQNFSAKSAANTHATELNLHKH